jgi:hypothetical protein
MRASIRSVSSSVCARRAVMVVCKLASLAMILPAPGACRDRRECILGTGLIVAISRFRVPPDAADKIAQRFMNRSRPGDAHDGLVGLEVTSTLEGAG